jgi:hypothetical protein
MKEEVKLDFKHRSRTYSAEGFKDVTNEGVQMIHHYDLNVVGKWDYRERNFCFTFKKGYPPVFKTGSNAVVILDLYEAVVEMEY